MTILDDIIQTIPASTATEKILGICRHIQIEEHPKTEHPNNLPKGPNIFLSLEVPGRRSHEISYISLEREEEFNYLAIYRTIFIKDYQTKDKHPKRVSVREIRYGDPKKVITEFAKIVKILRGE